jgi:hypothetical protein
MYETDPNKFCTIVPWTTDSFKRAILIVFRKIEIINYLDFDLYSQWFLNICYVVVFKIQSLQIKSKLDKIYSIVDKVNSRLWTR